MASANSLASFCWPKTRRLREDEEGTRAEDSTWRNKGWYDQNLLTCSLTPVSSSVPFQLIEALIIFRLTLMDVSN